MAASESAAQAASMQYQLAHLTADRSGSLEAVLVVGLVLSTIAVLLRIWSRKFMKAPLKWDDWTIIGSLVMTYGLCTCKFCEVGLFGLGTHTAAAGPAKVTGFLKCLYAFTILYMIDYPLIKISILLLYHRIFVLDGYRMVLKCGIICMLLFQISFVLVSIFICTPIHSFWDLSTPSKCITSVDFYIANSALNIFTDVALLILPMPVVWNLKVSQRQKIILSFIFVLGSMVLIASIFRIRTYLEIDNNDPLWTFVPCAIWTMVEIPLAIICACLPTMRPLLRGRLSDMFNSIFSKLSTGTRPSPSSSKTGPFQPLRNKHIGERFGTDEEKRQSEETIPATSTEQLKSTEQITSVPNVPAAYRKGSATMWTKEVADPEQALPLPPNYSNAPHD